MAYEKLNLECVSDSSRENIFVRIKRFDGKVFNNETKKFQDMDSNDDKSLIPLVFGAGLEASLTSASVEVDTTQFKDGEYYIYYYRKEVGKDEFKLFGISYLYVVDGKVGVQDIHNVTDVAIRLFEARVGDLSFRQAMLEIHSMLKTLLNK